MTDEELAKLDMRSLDPRGCIYMPRHLSESVSRTCRKMALIAKRLEEERAKSDKTASDDMGTKKTD